MLGIFNGLLVITPKCNELPMRLAAGRRRKQRKREWEDENSIKIDTYGRWQLLFNEELLFWTDWINEWTSLSSFLMARLFDKAHYFLIALTRLIPCDLEDDERICNTVSLDCNFHFGMLQLRVSWQQARSSIVKFGRIVKERLIRIMKIKPRGSRFWFYSFT